MTTALSNLPRPKTVSVAVWLYLAAALLGLVRILVTKGGPESVGAGVAWLVVAAYFVVVGRSLYKGRNWAKWWVVAITVLGACYLPWAVPAFQNGWEQAAYFVQFLMGISVATLLVVPASRPWFGA
jgi:hypothetical protein